MILNQVLVASGSEVRLPVLWVVAFVAAGAAIVLSGGSPLARVILGFVVGEAVALGGLVLVMSLRRPGTYGAPFTGAGT
jgi:hypothetical protein